MSDKLDKAVKRFTQISCEILDHADHNIKAINAGLGIIVDAEKQARAERRASEFTNCPTLAKVDWCRSSRTRPTQITRLSTPSSEPCGKHAPTASLNIRSIPRISPASTAYGIGKTARNALTHGQMRNIKNTWTLNMARRILNQTHTTKPSRGHAQCLKHLDRTPHYTHKGACKTL